MKKIISVILAIVMLLSVFPVMAQETEKEKVLSFEVLQTLGVIPENFDRTEKLTRSEFVSYVVKLMNVTNSGDGNQYFADVPYSHWAYNEVATAVGLGLIYGGGDGNFRPDDFIKWNEAKIIALRALNYGLILTGERVNLTDKYIKDLGLLKGITIVNEEVTLGDAFRLLFNTALAPYLVEASFTETNINFNENAKSLLETFWNIRYVGSIVYANDKTAVFGAQKLSSGYVQIGNGKYLDSKGWCKNYIGVSVDAFVQVVEPFEVVYASPSVLVKTVYISAKDIRPLDSEFNEFCIVAYDEATDKNIEYELDQGYEFLYNGIAFSGFDLSHFDIDAGRIKLINNNRDSLYDVVMVESFDNFVVDTISTYYSRVYDKLTGATLNLADNKNIPLYNEDGTAASFSDIEEGNILSVFYSHSGDVEKVYICKESKTLSPEESEEENTFIAGGKTYRIASSYVDYNEVELGVTAICYFDYDGEIAYAKIDKSNAYYGYLIGLELGTRKEPAMMRVLTEENNFTNYVFDEEVYFDDVKEDTNDALENFMSGDITIRQLIMYYADNDGVIKRVWQAETDNVTGAYQADETLSLDYLTNSGSEYRANSLKQIDDKYILKSDTKIFYVSENNEEEESKLSCSSSFLAEDRLLNDVNIELYNIGEDYTVPVMIYYAMAQADFKYNDPYFVIDKVTIAATEDGDTMLKVYGYSGKNYTSFYADADLENAIAWNADFADMTAADLGKGDVIQYHLDSNGKMSNMRIMYAHDIPDAYDETSDGDITSQKSYAALYTSSADVISHKNGVIAVHTNRLNENQDVADNIRTIPLNIVSNIYLYDSEEGRVLLADKNENIEDTRIFYVRVMNEIKLIVVYR